MSDIQVQLDRIEQMTTKILEFLQSERPTDDVKWLSESQAMQILNQTKRGISDIRRKNLIRCSTATGRNFLYYKPDVDRFMYDNSCVKKRSKNANTDKDYR